MEEADIKAPLYYVVGRKADVEAVQRLLTITPCFYGIAHDPQDKSIVQSMVTEVLFPPDSLACEELAEHVARTTGWSVLIVGDGDQLKAVYSTGEEETLCLSKLT